MSKPIETITQAEFDMLLLSVQEHYLHTMNAFLFSRSRLMLLIFYDAGLRLSELVNLRFCDVTLSYNQINLSICIEKTLKHGLSRTVKMTDHIRSELQLYIGADPLYHEHNLQRPLFHTKYQYKHLTSRAIQLWLHKLSVACIGRSIHPHVLRHTFATRLMRVAPMPVVQQLLGHKRLSSTQIYMHPSQDDCSLAIGKIQVPL